MVDARYIEPHGNGYRVKGPTYPSKEEALKARDRMMEQGDAVETTIIPTPLDLLDRADADRFWDAFKNWQSIQQATETEVDAAEITLPDNQPALFGYFDDGHLCHLWCRSDLIEHDLKLLGSTPGFYGAGGGDLFENVIQSSPAGSQWEQIARPRIQKLLARHVLGWAGDKIKAIVLGNHPGRSIKDDDFDPMAWLAQELEVPYFGPWGVLTVHLGSQSYRLLLAHSFRGRSAIHKTSQAKKALDVVGDCDAVFTGHTHDPASESAYVRQQARFFGQAGTYLAKSSYAKGLGYGRGQAVMPGALLFPDEHRLIGVHDVFTEGVHLLASYRSDVRCECQWCRQ